MEGHLPDTSDFSSTASIRTLSLDNDTSISLPNAQTDYVLNNNHDSTNNLADGSSHIESQTETTYQEEEDDPLGVKKLALSFDYLVYQIGERIQELAIQTERTVRYKKGIAQDQLTKADESIGNLRQVLKTCADLDNEFTKLEQLGLIVGDFKQRIRQLEEYVKHT